MSAHDANIAELRRIAPDLAPSIAKLTIPAYILDRDATVRWLNAAAVARFGDLRGKHIGQIVGPADVALARREFAAKLLGTQEASEGEVTIRTANGGRQTVEISSTQLLDQGAIVGVFGMASPTEEPAPAETEHTIDLSGFGCQHQDRQPRGLRAPAQHLAYFQSIHLRQHDIQND